MILLVDKFLVCFVVNIVEKEDLSIGKIKKKMIFHEKK